MEHKSNVRYENEYYAADDFRSLLPDGKYLAQCTDCESSYFSKDYHKLFLQFKVISDKNGNYGQETLFMVFNMPNAKRVGAGSRYFKAWRKVHGRPPSRNAIMTPKVFLKKNYIVQTRTVKRTFDGKFRDESRHYSVIDEIIQVIGDENGGT